MNIILGLLSILAGLSLWGVAITALVLWLGFCFGSVIVGVLLLIFAPYLLLAPLAIATPGTALIFIGMSKISNKE